MSHVTNALQCGWSRRGHALPVPPAALPGRAAAERKRVRLRAGVDILTFGQYLQPTPAHLDVAEYVTPEAFERWRRYGEDVVGFRCGRACAIAQRAQRCRLRAVSV